METQGAKDFLAVFTTYEVYLVACCCVAGMSVTKQVLLAIGRSSVARSRRKIDTSRALSHPIGGFVMSVGNVPMGALFGLIPEFLPGDHLAERMMVGAVAGFMSNTIYSAIKRFMPEVLASRDSKVRHPVGDES